MRYIGNKENLLDKIYQVMQSKNIQGNSFFDFFAGTTSVGRFFKKLNYQIYSSDLMYFSYVLQKAYLTNNQELNFEKLLSTINFQSTALFASPLNIVVEYLNQIEPIEGFISQNYTPSGTSELEIPRMYYSDENGKIIDAIRQKIESWKNENLINENEYFILLACLIETVPFYANISGVYAAFQKKWDPRAVKKMILRPIEFVINNKDNFVYNENSTELLNKVEADIFYLDPPYNQRQYAPNYHLLETIAKYDNPIIKGVAGLRDYQNQKSKFCNATTAIQELNKIANEGKFKTLILSYNTEGIMKQENIISTLEKYGKVELVEFEYLRFKSNSNGESSTKKFIHEQLYILQKNV
ncbi:DNA adenine methylase [Flavobacterium psychrophilum]|uniref:DNA adenine methylase n=1 Tax=Flavobacterium psychrophilum TaxID=96345 RepID=UPI002C8826DD|nr:DNA adenine methylase [Flavobacterium psychrophilum]